MRQSVLNCRQQAIALIENNLCVQRSMSDEKTLVTIEDGAIAVAECIGDLATAEVYPIAATGSLGTECRHWIHRGGAMRGDIASKECQQSKYDGHCRKSWKIPRSHSEEQSS